MINPQKGEGRGEGGFDGLPLAPIARRVQSNEASLRPIARGGIKEGALGGRARTVTGAGLGQLPGGRGAWPDVMPRLRGAGHPACRGGEGGAGSSVRAGRPEQHGGRRERSGVGAARRGAGGACGAGPASRPPAPAARPVLLPPLLPGQSPRGPRTSSAAVGGAAPPHAHAPGGGWEDGRLLPRGVGSAPALPRLSSPFSTPPLPLRGRAGPLPVCLWQPLRRLEGAKGGAGGLPSPPPWAPRALLFCAPQTGLGQGWGASLGLANSRAVWRSCWTPQAAPVGTGWLARLKPPWAPEAHGPPRRHGSGSGSRISSSP